MGNKSRVDPGVANELQPEWKNAPTAADLRNDLTSALSEHTHQARKVSNWLDALNTTGTAKVKAGVGRSSIVPKLIRKHAEWRYASLSEPLHTASTLFTASPVTHEDGDIAAQDGAILNHQFENEINKVKLIDESIRTGVDEGTVIYRTGWELETEMRRVPTTIRQGGIIVGVAEVNQEVVTVNRPTVTIVPFTSCIIDPNARGDVDNAQFVIYKFPTNISKLTAEGYENLDKLNVASLPQDDFEAGVDSRAYSSAMLQYKDEARKEFTAYEYWGFWDINDDKVLVPIIATFVGDTLIRLRENPFPDKKLPFVITQYLPVRNKNYGEPDGVLLDDNQKIIGALTRGMLDTVGRSAAGQQGYWDQALDTVNQKKFEQGLDYKFRADVDPSKAFHSHSYPELSSTGYNLLQLQAVEAESMTGVKTYGEGISGASLGDTAAGANGALGAAAKRESGILRRFADGLTQVANKVMMMSSEYLDPEAIQRITGKPYVQPQPGIRTTDVKVKIRTAEEDNQLAKDMAFLGQTTTDEGLKQLLTAKVADLKNMPEVAEMIRNYEPKPDPMALEIQQLQKQLLEAQIANELGKAHNNQSSGVLDIAKAQTETVKAENIAADTDLKRLEHVEEETGTNHERAKDLLLVQAEGNIHLESAKKSFEAIDTGKK